MPRSFALFGTSFVLALLLGALLASAQAASSTEEGQSLSESRTWETMLEGLEADAAIQSRMLDQIDAELPELVADLERALHKADNRLDQLILLRGVSGSTLWGYRTILLQLADLKHYIEIKKRPLIENKDWVQRVRDDYESLRGIRLKDKRRELDPTGKSSLTRLSGEYAALKHKTREVKDRIDAALTRADTLTSEIEAIEAKGRDAYAQTLKKYYFTPAHSLLSGSGWASFSEQFSRWTVNAPRYWYPLLSWVEWGKFLGILAVCWPLAFFAGKHLFGRICRRWPDLVGHSAQYMTGLASLTLAFAIGIGLSFTIFTTNQLTRLAAASFGMLGLGLLAGTWIIAGQGETMPRFTKRPFFTLWLVLISGDALHILNLPRECIGPIWLAVLLPACLRMRRLAKSELPAADRAIASASFRVLLLLAAATPFGFAAQALILSQLWFGLLLTLRIISALRWLCVVRPACGEETAPARNKPVSYLLYPFLAALILYLFASWGLSFMGGSGFARYVLHADFTVAGATLSVRALAYIVVLFFLARIVIYRVQGLLARAPIRHGNTDAALSHTLGITFSYAVWVCYLLTVLYILGVSLSALTWIASGLSVGIGFGMKDIVNNFVSGLIILFGGSIKKGDVIQHKTMIGEVTGVSVRNTTMRTLDNHMVIIPNSSFLKGDITNLSYEDARLRVGIPISLIPGSKVEKAMKIMKKVAGKHENVLSEPPPAVLYKGFGMFGLDFELFIWISDFTKQFETVSDIIRDLDQTFQEKKIQVAFRSVKTKYKVKKKPRPEENIRAKRKEYLALARSKRRRPQTV